MSNKVEKDLRVFKLAEIISDTRERKLPNVLLRLKEILDSTQPGDEDFVRIRQEIWDCNLLQMLILVLRQDFSVITGEYRTAVRLVNLLKLASSGLSLSRAEHRQFEEHHLPRAIDYVFLLARRIQAQITSIDEDEKQPELKKREYVGYLREILDSIVYLASGHVTLVKEILKSQWLLQLLITDERETVIAIITMLDKVIRVYGVALSQIDQKIVYSILDELIYKISVNNDILIGRSACKCILRVCDAFKLMVDVLCTRYKGLRPLLGKWHGKGFARDLKQLMVLLDTGSAKKAEMEKYHLAAICLQAWWKGKNTRSKLKAANTAFSKFQKSYRLKKAQEEITRDEMKIDKELRHRLNLNRQRIMREFKEKRLQMIEILPAALVPRFLQQEEISAAIKIQTTWRGHQQRNLLPGRRELAMQVKAAIKIQRYVRRWLDMMEQRQGVVPISLKPPGLTDKRMTELQQQISNWRESNPNSAISHEELTELHQSAAKLLHHHYATVRAQRKSQQKREMLLARLETDSELINLAPSLDNITQKDVQMYTSRSAPVGAKARDNHVKMLKQLQLPWWKKLFDEDDEPNQEEFQDDIMF